MSEIERLTAERNAALAEVERLQDERCDDRAPSLVPAPPEFCLRERGHGGWHEAEVREGLPPMRWIGACTP